MEIISFCRTVSFLCFSSNYIVFIFSYVFCIASYIIYLCCRMRLSTKMTMGLMVCLILVLALSHRSPMLLLRVSRGASFERRLFLRQKNFSQCYRVISLITPTYCYSSFSVKKVYVSQAVFSLYPFFCAFSYSPATKKKCNWAYHIFFD